MRVTIPASTAARALSTEILPPTKRKVNMKVQIFDPVTVYGAQQQNDLLSGVDAVGNPSRGLQFQQGIVDFLGITGPYFMTCNQQIEVEVQWWPL
jgi:hypothetical protein